MKYAVVRLSGSEYKVSEGETIKVNKLRKDFKPEVLMFVDGATVKIGNPVLDDVEVKTSSKGEEKGKKLRITRFKAKSRYDKTIGYRSTLSLLKIVSISTKGESKKAAGDQKVAKVVVAAKKVNPAKSAKTKE